MFNNHGFVVPSGSLLSLSFCRFINSCFSFLKSTSLLLIFFSFWPLCCPGCLGNSVYVVLLLSLYRKLSPSSFLLVLGVHHMLLCAMFLLMILWRHLCIFLICFLYMMVFFFSLLGEVGSYSFFDIYFSLSRLI